MLAVKREEERRGDKETITLVRKKRDGGGGRGEKGNKAFLLNESKELTVGAWSVIINRKTNIFLLHFLRHANLNFVDFCNQICFLFVLFRLFSLQLFVIQSTRRINISICELLLSCIARWCVEV